MPQNAQTDWNNRDSMEQDENYAIIHKYYCVSKMYTKSQAFNMHIGKTHLNKKKLHIECERERERVNELN